MEDENMKIVVIGGSELIGSKTVERLRKKGHDVVSAFANSGVNTITGEGHSCRAVIRALARPASTNGSRVQARAVEGWPWLGAIMAVRTRLHLRAPSKRRIRTGNARTNNKARVTP